MGAALPSTPRAQAGIYAARTFDLATPDGNVACAFGCTAAPLEALEADAGRLLSTRERGRLPAMTSDRRRLGFLRGRRAAKDALGLMSGEGAAGLHIEPGAFGQPVVEGVSRVGITLSHSDEVAVALAFPLTHPLGIDIEQVRPRNERALRSQLTDGEIASFVTPAADPLSRLTALWCIKEALSKVLGGGLAIDASVMMLSELREADGVLHARFAHIAHVTARACLNADMAVAAAMPHNAALDVAEFLAAATACMERTP